MDRFEPPLGHARSVAARLVGLAFGVSLATAACGENHHDVYIEALKIEGDAERHQCRLGFDPESKNNTVSSDGVAACLYELRRAKARYEHARSLGAKGRDLELKLEDLDAKISKLASMVDTITSIERDQLLDPT